MKKKCFLVFLFVCANISSQNWLLDFNQARTIAKDQNKKIVLVFSGSDWCAPCIKLDKSIWQSKTFKDFSVNNLILVKADFPRRKKNMLAAEQQVHNEKLAEAYNPNGYFPLVVIFDSQGKVLKETGYTKSSPDEFINLIKSL